MEVGKLTA